MTTSSERRDVRETIRQIHGLGDEWTVRFTAGKKRVAEMARLYRASGWEARAVPLVPDREDPGPGGPGRPTGADGGASAGGDEGSGGRADAPAAGPETGTRRRRQLPQMLAGPCGPCLEDTWVLLTRRSGAGGPDPDLPYE